MKKLNFVSRVNKLSVDLQKALLAELNAVIEEKLQFFEQIEEKNKKARKQHLKKPV